MNKPTKFIFFLTMHLVQYSDELCSVAAALATTSSQ